MNITAIILAAVVVGGTGLIIAILLGIASEKFKVPVNEKKLPSEQNFREITVEDADTQDVTDLRQQSRQEMLQ